MNQGATLKKAEGDLFQEIVETLLSSLNLKHIDRSRLGPETLLGKGGMDLDSIEMLEIVIAFEQKYGLKVSGPEEGREKFHTLGSLQHFIESARDQA